MLGYKKYFLTFRPLFAKILILSLIFNFIPPSSYSIAQDKIPLLIPNDLPLSLRSNSSSAVLNRGTRAEENTSTALLRGINLPLDSPFKFNFIITRGNLKTQEDAFKEETEKLIHYFLAALTIPDKDLWVNLSPHEKNRIIPKSFGKTEMGKDLLIQDYFLKQLTSSLMNPDNKLGKEFWQRVYTKVRQQFGSTEIPLNAYNKIWIVPSVAKVYEHIHGAFILKSYLKVMLEDEYFNTKDEGRGMMDEKNRLSPKGASVPRPSSLIIKEILLPEIEREVNEGPTFANLRQIYHAVILASWYKQALKKSLFGQIYVNQNKTAGIQINDEKAAEKIYKQYLRAFRKGTFNLLKEEYDPQTQAVIQRQYFSGGVIPGKTKEILEAANGLSKEESEQLYAIKDAAMIETEINTTSPHLTEPRDQSIYANLPSTIEEFLNKGHEKIQKRSLGSLLNQMNSLTEGKFFQAIKEEKDREAFALEIQKIFHRTLNGGHESTGRKILEIHRRLQEHISLELKEKTASQIFKAIRESETAGKESQQKGPSLTDVISLFQGHLDEEDAKKILTSLNKIVEIGGTQKRPVILLIERSGFSGSDVTELFEYEKFPEFVKGIFSGTANDAVGEIFDNMLTHRNIILQRRLDHPSLPSAPILNR